MKKNRILTLIILATFIISVIAFVPVNAATEAAPAVFPLYAGQSILVGEVQVWEDADYLYVKYITDDPWVMSETHLAVETSLVDIPQKNGNPIPGKFEFSDPHGLVDEYLYQIDVPPLGVINIAAHAKVQYEATLELVSGAGSAQVYGPLYAYILLNDPSWGSSVPSVVTWDHPSWPDIVGSSAVWISSAYEIENSGPSSWRKFEVNFDVPGIPLGGEVVTATADNSEAVYFNGALIGQDGYVAIPFDAAGGDAQEWGTVRDYAITPNMGANKLEFIVQNYAYPTDDPTINPTGLIYKVDVTYIVCETAWARVKCGDLLEFSGKNWATYFTYTVVDGEWDVTGSWVIIHEYLSDYYPHDMVITQATDGSLTGYGGNPPGGSYTYAWTITSGSVTGNTIEINAIYTSNAAGELDVLLHMVGTINPDGTITGTWDDNFGGFRTGALTTLSGQATEV